MDKYEDRVCKHCSPIDEELETNQKQIKYKDIIIWECCGCHFKTYYDNNGSEITKEEVFKIYPELLDDRIKRFEELKQTRCIKCATTGSIMWCWNLPWIMCEVKTLKEEIDGACKTPISAKEHINALLDKNV